MIARILIIFFLIFSQAAYALEIDNDFNGDVDIAYGGTNASTAAGARANLGLGNVDNTSDADKPISTATQAALDGKQGADADLDDLADGMLTGAKVGTGINASNITTGTLPDGVIPPGIARDSELPTDTNLTQEQVEDIVGAMVTGGTETGIDVTYDDSTGKFSFVVTGGSATVEDTAYDATWNGDLDGTSKNTIYDYLVNFDADADGDFTDEPWFPSGGSFTAWDDIIDPDAPGIIALGPYTHQLQLGLNGEFQITSPDGSDKFRFYWDGTDLHLGYTDGGSNGNVKVTLPPIVGLTLDASGFNGNLSPTDDTLQEVAQAVDDLSTSSGASITFGTTPTVDSPSGLYGDGTNFYVVDSGNHLYTIAATVTGYDRTPSGFTGVFQADTGAALSTLTTAGETYTVAGVDANTAISITGGNYQIDAGGWVSTSGTVSNGDVVGIQQTSSASYSTETIAALTIGTETVNYSVTTTGPPANYLSDANIVGAYYFENNGNDATSNGNNLTGVATPLYATSPTSQQGTYSAELSRTTGNYFSSADTDFNIAGALSYGGWFYFDDSANWYGFGGKHGTNSPDKGWIVERGTDGQIAFTISSDGADANSALSANGLVPVATWTHIVAVYDGSYMRLYINGSEATSGDFPHAYSSGVSVSSEDFKVGSSPGGSLNGHIDEIFVFDDALSSSEVSEIYTNGLE